MPQPVLSLLDDQLTRGKKAAASGHSVVKVTFKEKDGTTKRGFFKPCDKNGYPPLLAKYVVAFSIFVRAALGERASEERLVYNNLGDVVGTVSIEVPNFIPLLTYWDPDYKKESQKKFGNPDKETLIKFNVAELLISAYKHKNDDLHPANISLNGLIDWDELYRELTSILKGKQFGSGWILESPDTVNYINEQDLRTFPRISTRRHWPARSWKENINPLKLYKTNAFLDLESDPKLYPKFKHQYFTAILKELLAYDKEVLNKRMHLYLGEETLELETLPSAKREQLLKFGKQRKLFYDKEEKERSFVEHCSRFFSQEHQYFRKIVVNMPEFREFLLTLNKKSSEVGELKAWFEKNNSNNIIPYNLSTIDQEYHTLWRDSANKVFDEHFQELHNIIILSSDPDPDSMEKVNSREYSTEKVDRLITQLTTSDKEAKHKKSFYQSNEESERHERKMLTDVIIFQLRKKAKDLYRSLALCKNTYYAKSDLTIKDNQEFINEMTKSLNKSNLNRATFKKWLLNAREKLKHVKDIDLLMESLVFEMNHTFGCIDRFTAEFSDTLTAFRVNEIIAPLTEDQIKENNSQQPKVEVELSDDKSQYKVSQKKEEYKQTKILASDESSSLVPLSDPEESDPDYRYLSELKESKIFTDEKAVIATVSKHLASWIPTVDDSAIKKLVRKTRINEYDPKNKGLLLGWVYSKISTRGEEVDDMKLPQILATHKWNSTSLNTYIIKNLCLKMVDEGIDNPEVQLIFDEIKAKEKDYQWWGSVSHLIAAKSGLKSLNASPEQDNNSPSQARLI